MTKYTIEKKILRTISFLNVGRVFSSADFTSIAQPESIRTGLRRLCLAGEIEALGHSIYYKPTKTSKYPIGFLAERKHVINAIVRRFGWRIFPSVYASLTCLGLDNSKCSKYEILTTGPNKIFQFEALYFTGTIQFKHIPTKQSQVADANASMYVQTMLELGIDSPEITDLLARTSFDALQKLVKGTKGVSLKIRSRLEKALKAKTPAASLEELAMIQNLNTTSNLLRRR